MFLEQIVYIADNWSTFIFVLILFRKFWNSAVCKDVLNQISQHGIAQNNKAYHRILYHQAIIVIFTQAVIQISKQCNKPQIIHVSLKFYIIAQHKIVKDMHKMTVCLIELIVRYYEILLMYCRLIFIYKRQLTSNMTIAKILPPQ